MNLVEQVKAAIDERERRASLALRFRKDYLEHGKLETWVAVRHVNNHTPPYYDYWTVDAHLGALTPQTVLRRIDIVFGELDARFFAANGAPATLTMLVIHRELLAEHGIEHAGTEYQYCRVCHNYERHDAQAAPCPTLLALAKGYGIEVQ
jgi:hypothetical protein